MQQGVPGQRAYSQADAELDTVLKHTGAGGAEQQHDAKHGRQRYDDIGKSCIEVS